jgi:TPP-dependent 2-oxoacid decarboxylase
MKYFLDALIDTLPEKQSTPLPEREIPPFVPESGRAVTVCRLIDCLNSFLDDFTTVVADPGDALYGALDLWIHGNSEFLAPAYYNSLGFAIPAALAVQLAAPERRPLVLTGDGSFQMSGVELSTAVRHGLSPIVVVFNNGGYGTFRRLVKEEPHDIQNWRYAEFPRVIGGGEGYTVEKEDELAAALEAGRKNNRSPTVIDVRLGRDDCSPRLQALTGTLKNRV